MYLPLLLLLLGAAPAATPDTPMLSDAQKEEILAKTQVIRLDADLSTLSDSERYVVERLMEVGAIFQDVYESSRHQQALPVRRSLEQAPAESLDRRLYRQFQGPVVTTLDNQRRPIAGASPEVPGRNVYPWGVTREELSAFIRSHPERRAEFMDPLTVVRRADADSLRRDLAALRRHPVVAGLHTDVVARLHALSRKPDAAAFYAVPYAVAYAPQMVQAHALLRLAAARIEDEDAHFADYLRLRATDLLTNDYGGGDAAWVTGAFKTLNAQIGAYETYDDELFGQKAFYSLSILRRDARATARLEQALRGLQTLEDALPYAPRKKVRSTIPVGVYEVIADYGQARSANTASILPNDPDHASRYGRTVLLRANVLRHPEVHASNLETWKAAMAPQHHGELQAEGSFNRTVWHEIGHYLGPDRDAKGVPLITALEDAYSPLEEMKADLVSLYSAKALRESGHFDARALTAVYASGILRTLNNVRPRRAQPYQTMQLVQFNWFVDQGLLEMTPQGLRIHHARYHAAVASLLEKILALQASGDRDAAEAFLTRWSRWEAPHEELAARMRAKQRYRFRVPSYAAFGD